MFGRRRLVRGPTIPTPAPDFGGNIPDMAGCGAVCCVKQLSGSLPRSLSPIRPFRELSSIERRLLQEAESRNTPRMLRGGSGDSKITVPRTKGIPGVAALNTRAQAQARVCATSSPFQPMPVDEVAEDAQDVQDVPQSSLPPSRDPATASTDPLESTGTGALPTSSSSTTDRETNPESSFLWMRGWESPQPQKSSRREKSELPVCPG